ncbi:MAG TPA: FliM/FliN family flagellar motor switch protein, partial [Microthrixaceae bacterium]|nr:FliM/FliN family flagellar motor switch protein [Microthrixaceae bacterium]
MNQLETRTDTSGDETVPQSVSEVLLTESATLAEAIAEALSGQFPDGRIEVGPADIQADTADMTPKTGVNGVITSLKGGTVRRIVMMVDDEVQSALEKAHNDRLDAETETDSGADVVEARSAWLSIVAEPMEQWARLNHSTMDSALPIDNPRQIEHLLLGQGLVIAAVGLFLDQRHVGSIALAGFERSGANSDPAAPSIPADAASIGTTPQAVKEQDFAPSNAVSEAPLVAALHRLADVEMLVTAELGRTRMNVSELLTLGPGSIIELDRAAGSPVDLLVNNTLIARGEVVV